MADPEKPVRYVPASTFYGDILAARQAHESVADMWARMRDTLGTFNTPDSRYEYRFAPDTFQAVNDLTANAASVRTAQEVLNAASPSDSLTGDAIGHPFYGRSGDAFAALNAWEGKIELLMQRGGEQVSQWITVQYDSSNLPGSIGDLQDDLEGFANAWASRYEGELVGTGSIILNQI